MRALGGVGRADRLPPAPTLAPPTPTAPPPLPTATTDFVQNPAPPTPNARAQRLIAIAVLARQQNPAALRLIAPLPLNRIA